MKKTANNVIKLAKKEVGYLEKKSNKNLNSKTKNAGSKNYTKYNEVFGVNGCYWCAYFICWLFYTLCGNSKTKAKEMLCGCLSGACETIRQAFKKAGRYYSTPKKGDLVFFSGTRHAGANHIALIYKVTASNIYTIECNTSGGSDVVDNGGGVAKKSYSRNNSRILGYGRPKYENESIYPEYAVGETYTLQSEMNVRSGAGLTYEILKRTKWTASGRKHDKDKDNLLDKGTVVTCQKTKKVGVRMWMKIPSGWVCAYNTSTKAIYIK